MKIRLGYVAMTLSLKDCTPSGMVTVSAYNRLPDDDAKIYRLRKIAGRNLANTLRILRFNRAYDIKVYRLTSRLIPLATHPDVHWDYMNDLSPQLKEIGTFIRDNDIRVSAHPDHFTLINAKSEKVLKDSLRDLDYHAGLYEAMGLCDYKYKLVMHVGGLYGDKAASIKRFCENFIKLPERIRKRITLENDDKIYTAADVLEICREMKIPMVFDVHHHNCVNNGESPGELLPDIFSTWNGEYFKPKVHFSSPRDCKRYRNHADYIDFSQFMSFIDTIKNKNTDIDIMLEAKAKDLALLRLSGQLKETSGVKCISSSEFQIL